MIYFSLKIVRIVVARLWNSDSLGLTEEETHNSVRESLVLHSVHDKTSLSPQLADV